MAVGFSSSCVVLGFSSWGVVPTELTEYTEAYGLKLRNPQNGLRFARREFTELKGILGMVKTVPHTELSACLASPSAAQAINSVLSVV